MRGSSIGSIVPRLYFAHSQLRTRATKGQVEYYDEHPDFGSGGREHALAWAVKQNPKCDTLYAAPGNAGMAAHATCGAKPRKQCGCPILCSRKRHFIRDRWTRGTPGRRGCGRSARCRRVDIWPIKSGGPTRSVKSFTKEICDAANAPTAAYGHFHDAESAKAYVREQGAPIFKADDLAAGKGVIVAMDLETALSAIDDMFSGTFGGAGAKWLLRNSWKAKRRHIYPL